MVEIYNKRKVRVDPRFPELSGVHIQIKGRCILDGEIIITVDGVPLVGLPIEQRKERLSKTIRENERIAV